MKRSDFLLIYIYPLLIIGGLGEVMIGILRDDWVTSIEGVLAMFLGIVLILNSIIKEIVSLEKDNVLEKIIKKMDSLEKGEENDN